jgi:eukaryotic-like serine/threonine-protein kinase
MSKTYQTLAAFQKDYQYDLSDKESFLGEGSYGIVVEAHDDENNKKVALKIGKDLMQEFAAAQSLSHRNIAKYEACYRIADSSIGERDYAIMQLYADGNLSQLLEKVKKGDKQLNEKQLKELVKGILEGLQYLHQNKRIHRDFKPSNILISTLPNGNYRPLIADFGLTKVVGENDYVEGSDVELSDGRGTASYKAPEQIEGENAHYNLDLWAFGVILYEIITGDRPFKRGDKGSEQSRMTVLFDQIKSVQIPEQINTIAEPYQSIIRRCLVKDIHDRVRKEDELLDLLDGIPNLFEQAKIFIQKGEYSTSISIYETILKIRPDNKKAESGIENIKKLLQTSPNDNGFESTPLSLEIQAKSHFNAGEWSLAMSKYAEILTKDGQNKVAQQGIKACMTELDKQNKQEEETDDKKVETPKPKPTPTNTPQYKVFDNTSIWLGSYIGGPFIAGYMIAKNFKAFKDTQRENTTWIITILFLIFFFIVIFSIPEDSKIPNYIIPITYTAVASYLMQLFQGQSLAKHLSAGGQIHSRWRSAGIGLVGFVVTLVMIIGIAAMTESNKSYESTSWDSTTVDTTMAVDTLAAPYEDMSADTTLK